MTDDQQDQTTTPASPDEVLADEFVADLESLTTAELRRRRELAQQAEDRVSFARRVLQGRIDLLRAEVLARSEGGDDSDVLGRLAQVLADHASAPADPVRARAARSMTSGVDEEALAGAVTDLRSRTPLELEELGERYAEQERELSARRRRLFSVIDRLQEEVAERYRRGDASVDELLTGS